MTEKIKLYELDLDTVKMERNLSDLSEITNRLREENKKLGQEQKELTKSGQQNNKAFRDLGVRIEQNSAKITQNRTQYRQTSKVLNAYNHEKQKAIAINVKQTGSIDQKSKELASLKTIYRNLSQEERENKKIGGQLLKQIEKQDKEIKDLDASLGNHQRNVGNYVKTLFSWKSIIATLGIGSFVSVLRSASRTVIDFDKSVSNLASVMGKTKQEIKELRDSAIELAKTSKFTSSEVVFLQTELAKLGFSAGEIQDSQKGILNLASAIGADLAESASVAGNVLRGFGLDASESGRVADVMAKSFTSSALDLENFTEAMKFVAPIASSANIDLETTTALMGKLADAGLKGSIAGTALKNLLSKLSDENSKLSKEIGYSIKNSEDLTRAFKDLADKNIDLTDATELTDERSKAAFLTLIKGADSVEKLADALDRAGGSAQKMADTQLDSLSGKIALLNSSWDAFILSLEKGDGIFSKLAKGFLSGLSSVLDSLAYFNSTTQEQISQQAGKALIYIKEGSKTQKELIENARAMNKEASTQIEKYDKLEHLTTKEKENRISALAVIKATNKIIAEQGKGEEQRQKKEQKAIEVKEKQRQKQAERNKTRLKETTETAIRELDKEVEAVAKSIADKDTLTNEAYEQEIQKLAQIHTKRLSLVDSLLQSDVLKEEEAVLLKGQIQESYYKTLSALKAEQQEDLKRRTDFELEIHQRLLESKIETDDQRLEFELGQLEVKKQSELEKADQLGAGKNEIEQYYALERLETIASNNELELEQKKAFLDAQREIILANEALTKEQKEKILGYYAKKEQKLVKDDEKKKLKARQASNVAQFRAAAQTFSALSGLAQENSATQKQLLVGEALANTFASIPAIWSGKETIYEKIGATATSVASGLAAVAKIKSIVSSDSTSSAGGLVTTPSITSPNTSTLSGVPSVSSVASANAPQVSSPNISNSGLSSGELYETTYNAIRDGLNATKIVTVVDDVTVVQAEAIRTQNRATR